MTNEGRNLTYQQLKYLAHRPWTETDAEAAKLAGVVPQTVCKWKEDPYFVEQLESIWRGDLKRTQEIMARLRDKATLTLERLLASRDPRTRRAAAVDILDRAGMARGETVSVDLSPALAKLLGEAAGGEADNTDKENQCPYCC